MIALTAKAARRWKHEHTALPPVDAGAWVVDLLKLGRGPLLMLIVHQDTLFTLLRRAVEVKNLEQVATEVAKIAPGLAPDVKAVFKNGNRRVTGSITDMKYMIRVASPEDDLPALEALINRTPYAAIGTGFPEDLFAQVLDGGGDEMSRKKIKLRSIKGGRKDTAVASLPDLRAMEGMLREVAWESDNHDPKRAAQEIIYDAFDCLIPADRFRLARKALEIHPDCVDAMVLLAEQAQGDEEEIALLEGAVEAGERELGLRCFEKDVGHFWGLLETRPYMRARQALAQALRARGRLEEAADHMREMLRLNPNDNQGVRTVLLALLIEMGRDDEAEELYEKYAHDAFATMAYCAALLAFRREGDNAASRALLDDAVKTNRFVPAYLTGTRRMPRTLPDYIGFGDNNEAVAATHEMAAAWRATPGAIEWLASRPSKRR